MATKKPKKQKTFRNIEEINLEDRAEIGDRGQLYIKIPFKLTEKQNDLIDVIQNEKTNIVFIEGCAGVGKTFLAVLGSLKLYNLDSTKEQILYIRSIAESADKSIGALPGTLKEKTAPFIAPLLDKLEQLVSPEKIKEMFTSKEIEFAPINFLRGADWKDKIVILDEAQGLSLKELETVITRLGKNSKLIICGDSRQSDIGHKSGFGKMMEHFASCIESAKWGLEFFKFTSDDIVRSPFLKFIIEEIDKMKLNTFSK